MGYFSQYFLYMYPLTYLWSGHLAFYYLEIQYQYFSICLKNVFWAYFEYVHVFLILLIKIDDSLLNYPSVTHPLWLWLFAIMLYFLSLIQTKCSF